MVTEGVPSKETASGWDVANIRIIVVAIGSKEQQWAKENMVRGRRTENGERLRAKGLSI